MTVDGVEIAYLDRGNGPVVIIAHCSSASHKEWLQCINDLGPDWRVLAPDFIGYGQSGAWPEGKVFTGQGRSRRPARACRHDREEGASRRPFLWRGHGARSRPRAWRQVQSLTLVEPVSFNLLRVEGRPEWAEIEKLGVPWSPPCQRQGPRGGSGPSCAIGSAASAGGSRRRNTRRPSPRPFARSPSNSRSRSSQTPSLATTRAVKAPTLLIVGSKTRAPARAVVDMLGATLPNATVTVLNDAGHMSPFTHPSAVNRMIAGHLAAQQPMRCRASLWQG